MTQIDSDRPSSKALSGNRSRQQSEGLVGDPGSGDRSDDNLPADGDAPLFISPPPAPWPRIFPGL